MKILPIKQANIRQVFAFFTLIAYLGNQSVWAAPGIDFSKNSKSQNFFEFSARPSPYLIPPELGTILESNSSQPSVYLIQDAHGQYQAQKSAEEILDYLARHGKISTLLIEGGAGELHPERLAFFKEQNLNLKVADSLMMESQIGGAEKFLLKNLGRFSVYGIEDLDLYLRNFRLYQAVLNGKKETDFWVSKTFSELRDQAAKIFNKPFLEAFKDYAAFEEERADFPVYLQELEKQVSKNLHFSFQNPSVQLDWPMMVRYFELKRREPLLKIDQAKMQRESLIRWSLDQKISDDLIGELRSTGWKGDHNLRNFWERFYAATNEKGFKFENYPDLSLISGYEILQSEIDFTVLLKEISAIQEQLFRALAQKPLERQILQKYEGALILKKIFSLSLTRDEFQEFSRRTIAFEFSPEQKKTLEEAKKFYEAAFMRDQAMSRNISAILGKARTKTALIAGGFHTRGLCDYFLKNNIPYAVVTPHVSAPENETRYASAMSGLEKKIDFESGSVRFASWMQGWNGSYRLPRATQLQRRSILRQINIFGKKQNAHPGKRQEVLTSKKTGSSRSEMRMTSIDGSSEHLLADFNRKILPPSLKAKNYELFRKPDNPGAVYESDPSEGSLANPAAENQKAVEFFKKTLHFLDQSIHDSQRPTLEWLKENVFILGVNLPVLFFYDDDEPDDLFDKSVQVSYRRNAVLFPLKFLSQLRLDSVVDQALAGLYLMRAAELMMAYHEKVDTSTYEEENQGLMPEIFGEVYKSLKVKMEDYSWDRHMEFPLPPSPFDVKPADEKIPENLILRPSRSQLSKRIMELKKIERQQKSSIAVEMEKKRLSLMDQTDRLVRVYAEDRWIDHKVEGKDSSEIDFDELAAIQDQMTQEAAAKRLELVEPEKKIPPAGDHEESELDRLVRYAQEELGLREQPKAIPSVELEKKALSQDRLRDQITQWVDELAEVAFYFQSSGDLVKADKIYDRILLLLKSLHKVDMVGVFPISVQFEIIYLQLRRGKIKEFFEEFQKLLNTEYVPWVFRRNQRTMQGTYRMPDGQLNVGFGRLLIWCDTTLPDICLKLQVIASSFPKNSRESILISSVEEEMKGIWWKILKANKFYVDLRMSGPERMARPMLVMAKEKEGDTATAVPTRSGDIHEPQRVIYGFEWRRKKSEANAVPQMNPEVIQFRVLAFRRTPDGGKNYAGYIDVTMKKKPGTKDSYSAMIDPEGEKWAGRISWADFMMGENIPSPGILVHISDQQEVKGIFTALVQLASTIVEASGGGNELDVRFAKLQQLTDKGIKFNNFSSPILTWEPKTLKDRKVVLERRLTGYVGTEVKSNDRIYKVDMLLDKDGRARVYRAKVSTQALPAYVAVKFLKDLGAAKRDFLRLQLKHEQDALRLASDNGRNTFVPRYLGAGYKKGSETEAEPDQKDNKFYLVMEYLQGKNLGQWSEDKSPEQRIEMADKVLRAAASLHGPNPDKPKLVHLDLKPSNIMVTASDEPKIVDFTTAQIGDKPAPYRDPNETRGTYLYMAPEMLKGVGPYKPSTDIFLLGATIFEVLTGKKLFSDKTLLGVMMNRGKRIPETALENQLNGPFEKVRVVLRQALDVDPELRYANAGVMLEAFEKALGQVKRSELRSANADLIGKTVHWRDKVQYRVERELGSGGEAVVFLLMPVISGAGKPLALKLFNKTSDKLALNLAHHEQLVMGKVFQKDQTPHSPQVLATGRLAINSLNKIPYLMMEYIEGPHLDTWAESKTPEAIIKMIPFVLLSAEKQLYQPGVVHLDLKPANILISKQGPVIIDYSLSQMGGKLPDFRRTDKFWGSIYYAPPEMTELLTGYTHAADIYELGETLFKIITKEHLVNSESPVDVMDAKKRGDLPGAEEITRRIGFARGWYKYAQKLGPWLARAMAAKPEDRFQSPSEMLRSFNEIFPPARSEMRSKSKDAAVRWLDEIIARGVGPYKSPEDFWSVAGPELSKLVSEAKPHSSSFFSFAGFQIAEYFKKRGWVQPYGFAPEIAWWNTSFISEFYMASERRLRLLAWPLMDSFQRLDMDAVLILSYAMHLNFYGAHSEATESDVPGGPGKKNYYDHELLIQSLRRFFAQEVELQKTAQWNSPLEKNPKYRGFSPRISRNDLMLWFIALGLDLAIYDVDLAKINGGGEALGARSVWAQGGRDSIPYFLREIFTEIRKPGPNGELTGDLLSKSEMESVYEIAAQALSRTEDDWRSLGFIPPSEFRMKSAPDTILDLRDARALPFKNVLYNLPAAAHGFSIKFQAESRGKDTSGLFDIYPQKYGKLTHIQLTQMAFLFWPELTKTYPDLFLKLNSKIKTEERNKLAALYRKYPLHEMNFTIPKRRSELRSFRTAEDWKARFLPAINPYTGADQAWSVMRDSLKDMIVDTVSPMPESDFQLIGEAIKLYFKKQGWEKSYHFAQETAWWQTSFDSRHYLSSEKRLRLLAWPLLDSIQRLEFDASQSLTFALHLRRYGAHLDGDRFMDHELLINSLRRLLVQLIQTHGAKNFRSSLEKDPLYSQNLVPLRRDNFMLWIAAVSLDIATYDVDMVRLHQDISRVDEVKSKTDFSVSFFLEKIFRDMRKPGPNGELTGDLLSKSEIHAVYNLTAEALTTTDAQWQAMGLIRPSQFVMKSTYLTWEELTRAGKDHKLQFLTPVYNLAISKTSFSMRFQTQAHNLWREQTGFTRPDQYPEKYGKISRTELAQVTFLFDPVISAKFPEIREALRLSLNPAETARLHELFLKLPPHRSEMRSFGVGEGSEIEIEGKAYKIGKKIASGGLSYIYQAEDLESGKSVAVKLFKGDSEPYFDSARREFEILKRLKENGNTATTQAIGFGEADGFPVIVMELILGKNLREWWENKTTEEKIGIVTPILKALSSVHALGIKHLDLKLDNIMVTDQGEIKIVDFGSAGLADEILGGSTPLYAAPEIFDGSSSIASDIYTIASIIYEIAAGARLFPDAVSLADIMVEKLETHFTESEIKRRFIDRGALSWMPVVPVLVKALAMEPANRYQNAGEMLKAWEEVEGIPAAKSELRMESVSEERVRQFAQSLAEVYKIVPWETPKSVIFMNEIFLRLKKNVSLEDYPRYGSALEKWRLEIMRDYPEMVANMVVANAHADMVVNKDGNAAVYLGTSEAGKSSQAYGLSQLGNEFKISTNDAVILIQVYGYLFGASGFFNKRGIRARAFSGDQWFQHKLVPSVSPVKSIIQLNRIEGADPNTKIEEQWVNNLKGIDQPLKDFLSAPDLKQPFHFIQVQHSAATAQEHLDLSVKLLPLITADRPARSEMRADEKWVPINWDKSIVNFLLRHQDNPVFPRISESASAGKYERLYAEGPDMERWAYTAKDLNDDEFEKQVVEWTLEIGKAVEIMEAEGFEHGDLQPRNVVIVDGKHPQLIDFSDEYRNDNEAISGFISASLLARTVSSMTSSTGFLESNDIFVAMAKHDLGLRELAEQKFPTVKAWNEALEKYYQDRWTEAKSELRSSPLIEIKGKKYRRKEELSRWVSGTAKVYRVEAVKKGGKLPDVLVVKIYPRKGKWAAPAARKELIRHEVKTATHYAEFNNPYALKIYSSDDFVAMDYFKNGMDLEGWLETNPTPAKKIAILKKVIAAAAEAYSRGIVHRDLKTTNFLTDGKNVKLIDFALSQLDEKPSPYVGKYNPDNHIIATFAYISPDIFYGDGKDVLTPASDVFQLGLIMQRFMTGKTPLLGKTQDDIDFMFENWVHLGEHEVLSKTFAPFVDVINTAADPNEWRRYKNPVELLEAFNRVLRRSELRSIDSEETERWRLMAEPKVTQLKSEGYETVSIHSREVTGLYYSVIDNEAYKAAEKVLGERGLIGARMIHELIFNMLENAFGGAIGFKIVQGKDSPEFEITAWDNGYGIENPEAVRQSSLASRFGGKGFYELATSGNFVEIISRGRVWRRNKDGVFEQVASVVTPLRGMRITARFPLENELGARSELREGSPFYVVRDYEYFKPEGIYEKPEELQVPGILNPPISEHVGRMIERLTEIRKSIPFADLVLDPAYDIRMPSYFKELQKDSTLTGFFSISPRLRNFVLMISKAEEMFRNGLNLDEKNGDSKWSDRNLMAFGQFYMHEFGHIADANGAVKIKPAESERLNREKEEILALLAGPQKRKRFLGYMGEVRANFFMRQLSGGKEAYQFVSEKLAQVFLAESKKLTESKLMVLGYLLAMLQTSGSEKFEKFREEQIEPLKKSGEYDLVMRIYNFYATYAQTLIYQDRWWEEKLRRSELRSTESTIETAGKVTAKILGVDVMKELYGIMFPPAIAAEPKNFVSQSQAAELVEGYAKLFKAGSVAVLPASLILNLSEKAQSQYFDLIYQGFKQSGENSKASIYFAGEQAAEFKNKMFKLEFFKLNPAASKIFEIVLQNETVTASRRKNDAVSVSVTAEPEDMAALYHMPSFLIQARDIKNLEPAQAFLYMHHLTQLQLLAAVQLKRNLADVVHRGEYTKLMAEFLQAVDIAYTASQAGLVTPQVESLLSETLGKYLRTHELVSASA